jgi:tellurium resistance protein TerZ
VARSFGDLLPVMQDSLRDVLPDLKVTAFPVIPSLTKGETISLGPAARLTDIVVGIGWDRGSVDIDLDLSCLIYSIGSDLAPPASTGTAPAATASVSTAPTLSDAVYYNCPTSTDGSVRLSGDNKSGGGDGDDESIRIDLSAVPASVHTLFLLVHAFNGHLLSSAKNAFFRLFHEKTRTEIVRFTLADNKSTGC